MRTGKLFLIILVGMCASRMSLVWMPERQQSYVEQLELNLELQMQFEAAIDARNVDTAAFCLRSWIMQAASEHCVGMSKFQTWIFRKSAGGGVGKPVWFDAECKQETRLCGSCSYWSRCARLQAIKKRV